jgi:hypothetical protein
MIFKKYVTFRYDLKYSDLNEIFMLGKTGCYRTPLCWYESGESALLGPEVVQETMEKVMMIQGKMKTSQSRQKS